MTRGEIRAKAEDLRESVFMTPHVEVVEECIMSALLEARDQTLKDAAAIFQGEGSTTYAAVRSTLLSLVESPHAD